MTHKKEEKQQTECGAVRWTQKTPRTLKDYIATNQLIDWKQQKYLYIHKGQRIDIEVIGDHRTRLHGPSSTRCPPMDSHNDMSPSPRSTPSIHGLIGQSAARSPRPTQSMNLTLSSSSSSSSLMVVISVDTDCFSGYVVVGVVCPKCSDSTDREEDGTSVIVIECIDEHSEGVSLSVIEGSSWREWSCADSVYSVSSETSSFTKCEDNVLQFVNLVDFRARIDSAFRPDPSGKNEDDKVNDWSWSSSLCARDSVDGNNLWRSACSRSLCLNPKRYSQNECTKHGVTWELKSFSDQKLQKIMDSVTVTIGIAHDTGISWK